LKETQRKEEVRSSVDLVNYFMDDIDQFYNPEGQNQKQKSPKSPHAPGEDGEASGNKASRAGSRRGSKGKLAQPGNAGKAI
jgi:hypothetical protein